MIASAAVTEILALVKRPDKAAMALQQINRAISFYSLKVEWARDLVETTLTFDAESYTQEIDISTVEARFRKVKYINPIDTTRYIRNVDVTQILGSNGQAQRDVFYIAGTTANIVLSDYAESANIGLYTYPAVLAEADSHWMLDVVPYMIIEKAVSKIFQSIGDDASFRFYEASATELFLAARKDLASSVSESAS